MRADLLETSILQDVKDMFRDEQLMARIWEEANRRLAAERPNLETEIEKIETQIAKVRATIDRYFAAFEAGTMKPALCTQKVEDLNAQVAELEVEKQNLEARRKRLELPALDRQMLSNLMDDFEKVLAEGTNPQKKDLLHRLVKKVLIHDRHTIEIWYALPNQASVRTPAHTAPQMCRYTNPSYLAEPEVWFRIRLVSLGLRAPPVARFCDQTVEIALGPRKAFETVNIGALTRRVAADQIVAAARARRRSPRPPRAARPPRIVGLLRKAIAWRALLDSGEVPSKAEIARREGITRARVTQVMGLLRLDPGIQRRILTIPQADNRSAVTERALRIVMRAQDPTDQQTRFDLMVGSV